MEKRERPDPLIEGFDFYNEGRYTVFTEHYLRSRGDCCKSACRHCPWGYRADQRGDAPLDEA